MGYKSAVVAVLFALVSLILTTQHSNTLYQCMIASLTRKMATQTAETVATNLTAATGKTARQLSREVVKKVYAVETPEGAGAVVRRSIGTPQLRNFSPFLMLDHFKVAEGAGFPDHPHRGQTTVTYMLEGQFQHEDFTGRTGLLSPGDLQWMLAGEYAHRAFSIEPF